MLLILFNGSLGGMKKFLECGPTSQSKARHHSKSSGNSGKDSDNDWEGSAPQSCFICFYFGELVS